ncbi:MAG: hypothetical protein AB7F75_01230 [Planctomycetota bacterium]
MKKVTPGDPIKIPAQAYNSFIDAARAHRERSLGQGAGEDSGLNIHMDLQVRNSTGADQDEFAVLSLGSIVLSPVDNLPLFKDRPTFDVVASTITGRTAILQEPLKMGALGWARILGISVVRINVIDESHSWAKVVAGSPNLESSFGGVFRILYKESGTGLKWGLVEFPSTPPLVRRFRVQSDHGDHIKCKGLTGGTLDAEMTDIAKNFLCRRTPFDGQVRAGVSYAYVNDSKRTATQGAETETQVIVPSFVSGDEILAMGSIPGGTNVMVSGVELLWQDLNLDGRAWAKEAE